jgi:thymidylate synthase ThyX
MTKIFELYRDSIPPLQAIMADKYPREDNQPEGAWKASVRAKTLDLLRGMLPSAALSHVGMYASGQAYENMLLRMLGHPLPEARDYGQRILDELKIVIPSFVSRVERADRGGKRIKYQNDRREAITNLVKKFGLDSYQVEAEPNSVELVYSRGSENDILSAGLFELSDCSQTEINKIVETLPEQDKISLVHAIVGDRENRRHRPGRCFESVSYRFEIVSDYGAFRDLQRHRMLTCQWQALTPELGAEVPEELPQDIAYNYQKALEVSSDAYYRLVEKGFDSEAPYTLCLGYKMRYVLELNAREAMQLIELRSGVEGHPSYRAVAQEMHRLISQKHPMIGQAMQQVDLTQEPRLERLLSEIRTHNKQKANNK